MPHRCGNSHATWDHTVLPMVLLTHGNKQKLTQIQNSFVVYSDPGSKSNGPERHTRRDRQTDRPRYICINRPHLCAACMRCGLTTTTTTTRRQLAQRDAAREVRIGRRGCSQIVARFTVTSGRLGVTHVANFHVRAVAFSVECCKKTFAPPSIHHREQLLSKTAWP